MAAAGQGSGNGPRTGKGLGVATRPGVGKRVDKQEAALRENLKRRKAAARRRSEPDAPVADLGADDTGSDGGV